MRSLQARSSKGGGGGAKGAQRFAIRRALSGGSILIPAKAQINSLDQVRKVRGESVNRVAFIRAGFEKLRRQTVFRKFENDGARSRANARGRRKRDHGGKGGGRVGREGGVVHGGNTLGRQPHRVQVESVKSFKGVQTLARMKPRHPASRGGDHPATPPQPGALDRANPSPTASRRRGPTPPRTARTLPFPYPAPYPHRHGPRARPNRGAALARPHRARFPTLPRSISHPVRTAPDGGQAGRNGGGFARTFTDF